MRKSMKDRLDRAQVDLIRMVCPTLKEQTEYVNSPLRPPLRPATATIAEMLAAKAA